MKAALFDFDGVVMDTESQYSIIWDAIGQIYHPEINHFDMVIKGQTLTQIFAAYFPDKAIQNEVIDKLYAYEAQMKYVYTPRCKEYLLHLRSQGIKTALVTSSNDAKMKNVYRDHPDFSSLWDEILTADMFSHSKPHPECYLMAAKMLSVNPADCVVYEDSLHGLKAGRAAGMYVVGLATTYSRDVITPLADEVIDSFEHYL